MTNGVLISPAAIAPAARMVKKIFFRPFSLKKWLLFGLIGLVLGQAGLRINFNGNLPGPDKYDTGDLGVFVGQVADFVGNHVALIGLLAVTFLLVAVIFGVAYLWLRSVFEFVFVDAVVKNEVRIRKSFVENHSLGFSLFRWNVGMVALGFLVAMPFVLGAAALGLAGAQALDRSSTALAIGIAVFFFALGVPGLFVLGLAQLVARDFVVPVMYAERRSVLGAWKRVLGVLARHKGDTLLYLLLRVVLGMGFVLVSVIVAVVALVAVILALAPVGAGVFFLARAIVSEWRPALVATAVVMAGPVLLAFVYLGNTVISPFTSFFRIYPLVFLSTCDDKLQLVEPVRVPVHVSPAGGAPLDESTHTESEQGLGQC